MKDQSCDNTVFGGCVRLVHLADDYAKLRGRAINTCENAKVLLNEALHALRRDPPKVHVMIDHAERVLDSIQRFLDKTRAE